MKITINQERNHFNAPTAIDFRIEFGNPLIASMLGELWPSRERANRILETISRFGYVEVAKDKISYEISNTSATRLFVAVAAVLSYIVPAVETLKDKIYPEFEEEIQNIKRDVEAERKKPAPAPSTSSDNNQQQ